jgi:hypothetical protein
VLALPRKGIGERLRSHQLKARVHVHVLFGDGLGERGLRGFGFRIWDRLRRQQVALRSDVLPHEEQQMKEGACLADLRPSHQEEPPQVLLRSSIVEVVFARRPVLAVRRGVEYRIRVVLFVTRKLFV